MPDENGSRFSNPQDVYLKDMGSTQESDIKDHKDLENLSGTSTGNQSSLGPFITLTAQENPVASPTISAQAMSRMNPAALMDKMRQLGLLTDKIEDSLSMITFSSLVPQQPPHPENIMPDIRPDQSQKQKVDQAPKEQLETLEQASCEVVGLYDPPRFNRENRVKQVPGLQQTPIEPSAIHPYIGYSFKRFGDPSENLPSANNNHENKNEKGPRAESDSERVLAVIAGSMKSPDHDDVQGNKISREGIDFTRHAYMESEGSELNLNVLPQIITKESKPTLNRVNPNSEVDELLRTWTRTYVNGEQ